MTRAGAGALVVIALVAGLTLRFVRLDVQPMHNDEANQAVKFGALLERGEYRYDAEDHHGPTLYYLSLPAAWMRGQPTFASVDEYTLRGVTAAFGAATILLLPLLSRGIGRTAVAAGAVLAALSPALVFYSRMFIQEALFACFTLAFLIALGRLAVGGGLAWSAMAGVTAGLAVATKETSVIVLPAAFGACAIAWWSLAHHQRRACMDGRWRQLVLVGLTAAAVVAAMFYSSFFVDPRGLLGPFQAAGTYFARGVDPADHINPWYFYFARLTYWSSGGLRWSEGLVLVLAIAGAVSGWSRLRPAAGNSASTTPPDRIFWTRYFTCYVVIVAALFSAIPYKTPWNLLPFYVAMTVLAGIGFVALIHATASGAVRAALVTTFVIASGQLGWQAWRASVIYASDQRNPYVYAHTVPDAVRMGTRIRDLTAVHPDGSGMQVSVIAPPHEQWPLPWYLRTLPHVGYWTTPGDALALQAPVIVVSTEHTEALDGVLGDRYVSEFYGLRPEVLLTLYIERALWERFLARAAESGA